MFKHICNCRAFAQRPFLTSQRWMSSRPTYNAWLPQPDADGWYDGRKHPRRLEEFDNGKTRAKEDQRVRANTRLSAPSRSGGTPARRSGSDLSPRSSGDASRNERGRDERFSTSLSRRSRPRRSHRDDEPPAPKRKGGGFVLMPKLSQEELDKISKPKDVWEARSLYFVPPKRSKEHQKPIRQPKPPKPEPSRRNRDAAAMIASPDAIKAAISISEKDLRLARRPPPPPPEIELEGDGGSLVADPIASDDVLPHALAARFFLSPPATFLYSAFRLKHHPLNTTTPEICVVGASNCGKSSFINALTGAASLAKVSDRAGKTVSMNAYGVGPLTGLPFRKPVASPSSSSSSEGGGGVTKEEKPEHGIILVDTPGYGYASHEEWGREIVEYINKRTMLRGIVLLLSSEKKVSEKDAQIVKLLADAGRPVMLVFTKMDKALSRKAREEGGIAQRLREAERCFARTGWDGWVKRVYITAARMERDKSWKVDEGTRSGAAGMAGVRMGVLELAGVREFVAPEKASKMVAQRRAAQKSQKTQDKGGEEKEEKRLEPGKALESDPAAWSGDVVSFEELEKKFGDWSS